MTSLHDPLELPCGLVLPNRIMKAAMSEALADPGNSPGPRLERLYRTWSQGGYGLLVTGNVMVGHDPDLSRGRLATTVAMLRRNGAASFRPKRGIR